MAARSKRRRDYKAEYARRVARGLQAGKSRQAARGHTPKEHVERARRTRAKYGASPGQLTRLRKAAFDRIMALYVRTARNPVNEATVHRGMRLLHADDLRRIAEQELDDMDLISAQKVSDSYLDQLAEYFPESIDDIVDDGFNPLWYHR